MTEKDLPHITTCPYCKAERKTGKGMYDHLIKRHNLKMDKAWSITYMKETVPPNPDEMLLGALETCREGGKRNSRDAFDMLVSYMGKKLGLHNEELSLSPSTVSTLDTTVNLNALKSEINDYLGHLFSLQKLGNNKTGQCFTPFHISEFMAQLQGATNIAAGQNVLDPCCGTGSMLLAARKHSQPGVVLCGVEIDRSIYRAALVQLSLFTDNGARNPFKLICTDFLTTDVKDPQVWANANQW